MIRVADLVHTFQEPGLPPRTVLDIPEWQVGRGDHLLLRGKSGSGKTTLLNILAGLLTPSRGQVEIDGQALGKLTEARRDRFRAQYVGYVFQTHNLLPFSAIDNVEMPLAFLGVKASLRRQRAADALASVGLSDWAAHRPHQMSTGQRLRVAIARALVTQPKIVLADEPTAALDRQMAGQIMDLLQESARRYGATLLVASHDPTLTSRFPRIVDLQDTCLHECQRTTPMEGTP